MSKYVADIIRHYAKNGIVRQSDVIDYVAYKMLNDSRTVESTEKELQNIQILTNHTTGLDRVCMEIQFHMGKSFLLKSLETKHPNLYSTLRNYGNASSLLKERGINAKHSPTRPHTAAKVREDLRSFVAKGDGTASNLKRRSPRLYQRVLRQAKKEGITVGEWVRSRGFKYGKESE